MHSRDAWQAAEVGGIQGQDMGYTLRKHHRCKPSIVRALASDFGGFDQGEPAFEGSGPFIEQYKLAAQARDHVSGLVGGHPNPFTSTGRVATTQNSVNTCGAKTNA